MDDPIPRPVTGINTQPGKMLALPIPSVRPMDINEFREPGYMGINPITLMGETGLLPGSWGQGKEFVKAMPWPEPRERTGEKQLATGRNGASRQQLRQEKSDAVTIDMRELRTQYAKAVLDGDTCEESSTQSRCLPFAMRSTAKPPTPEICHAGGDETDWVDVSDGEDDEDTIDGQKESGHKRDDSGYSSGDIDQTLTTDRTRPPVVPQRKNVCFDERPVEKERRAWELPNA